MTHQGGRIIFQHLTFPFSHRTPSVVSLCATLLLLPSTHLLISCSHPHVYFLTPSFQPLTSLPTHVSPNNALHALTSRPLMPLLKAPILLFWLPVLSLLPSFNAPQTHTQTQICLHVQSLPAPLQQTVELQDCGPRGKPEGAISRGEETGSIITHTFKHIDAHF